MIVRPSNYDETRPNDRAHDEAQRPRTICRSIVEDVAAALAARAREPDRKLNTRVEIGSAIYDDDNYKIIQCNVIRGFLYVTEQSVS